MALEAHAERIVVWIEAAKPPCPSALTDISPKLSDTRDG
jgi:hypothetical protein